MSVLTLQSDRSILLDSEHADAEAAHFSIAPFSELVKTPGPLHSYRLTPLSLWNAAAAGWEAADILAALEGYSDQRAPEPVRDFVLSQVARYGRVWIDKQGEELTLRSVDAAVLDRLAQHASVRPLLSRRLQTGAWLFAPEHHGALKQALQKLHYPADDRVTFRTGAPLALALREDRVALRDYQREAVDRMVRGGSGVVVLPCGAGKTVVGLGLMAALQSNTLILTPSIIAARQWANELITKTSLDAGEIGEYSGERKQVQPVTIATYQILTQFAESVDRQTGEVVRRPNLSIFGMRDWGLIIYDEVHLLPAPIFRLTAEIQTTRRLGLTATLVREDGREGDVFTLIGPTRYQAGWKALERAGWIAEALCTEVRIELEPEERLAYVQARPVEQARLAAENSGKLAAVQQLVARHGNSQVLIIGQYLAQLQRVAEMLGAPLITGRTPNAERAALYRRFRASETRVLVVSRVANMAVDLPDANVAIQISGTFGSRQEEAQRLGRVLRPKANGAQSHFYTIVAQDTVEQGHAARRQRFLVEQGYQYRIASLRALSPA